MQVYWFAVIFIFLSALSVNIAYAVPPPDFIFNIGSQIAQVFAFAVLGFSIVIGAFRRFFQMHPIFVKYRKVMWFLLALLVAGISYAIAYQYDKYKQNKAYTEWVGESRQQQNSSPAKLYELDKLKLGQLASDEIGSGNLDAGANFIKSYYQYLDSGNYAAAYEVSKKSVSFETYKGWYKDTTSLKIDSIQKISENYYSLGLTLTETTGTIRYAVLMKIKQTAKGKFAVESSDVKILASKGVIKSNQENISKTSVFFDENKNLDLNISNEDFQKVIESKSKPYILDAREDEEYEIGYFPGSVHIRFADLLSGEWIRLPEDRIIYVLCWSGIRGKEVAEFLRTKNMVSRYLDKGADGWVSFGGTWIGGIKFLSKYTEERYQIVFSTQEVKKYSSEGVILVDSRDPASFAELHLPGSISIPVIYTPTSKMEEVLSQVPPTSKVITICDDFVSCFDAKITGVKLEKRGNTFLGRYNKPWEFFK